MLVGLIGFGLVVGALTGLMGAGGGIIAVPALVYVVGVPLATAVSTSLVMGGVAPIAALAPRLRGGVEWRTVGVVVAGGVPAAFAGTAAGARLPQDVVLLSFTVLMVVAGVQMLRPRPSRATAGTRPRFWALRAAAVGAVVGFLTGLLGIGGGFITVPALVLALDLPIGLAIGTSLAVTVVNSLAGIVAHAGTTSPDWPVALAFAIPAVVASLVTARAARRVSGRALQVAFAVVVFVVAAVTAAQVVLG